MRCSCLYSCFLALCKKKPFDNKMLKKFNIKGELCIFYNFITENTQKNCFVFMFIYLLRTPL